MMKRLRSAAGCMKNSADFNHKFYEKVFELLLRLKANYLWPAMWNNAFNEDDPDESHSWPTNTASSWERRTTSRCCARSRSGSVTAKARGTTQKTPMCSRQFWTEGVERNKNYESIVTLGMRGDGDHAHVATKRNIELLEKIVADQRKILAEHVNPDVTKIPAGLGALQRSAGVLRERHARP